jgi:hypothetical protein
MVVYLEIMHETIFSTIYILQLHDYQYILKIYLSYPFVLIVYLNYLFDIIFWF